MDLNPTPQRFTIRDLPLPAKLVLTVFLMAVGLGYGWAMMQLHFKHASKGELFPGSTSVVERFSGVRPPWEKEEPPPAEPKPADHKAGNGAPGKLVAGVKIKSLFAGRCADCHGPKGEKKDIPLTRYADIAKLVATPPAKGKMHIAIAKENDDDWNKDNMTQAFTKKSNVKVGGDEVEWKDFLKDHPDKVGQVRAERDTERKALLAWLDAGAPEDAYEKDAFPLPPELRGKPLTKDYATQAPELSKEEKAAADAGQNAAVTVKKRKNAKERQLSVESLTQSTHAHLLSFAVLWACTGLIFAFTSYSFCLRLTLAPLVLAAQVIDVCFWWLARLSDVGPYFALGIMGTGGLVGLGLSLQILLSLFNMYGGKGKAVLLALLLAGGAGGGLVFVKYVQPHIAEEAKG
jgi:hypothetical protein